MTETVKSVVVKNTPCIWIADAFVRAIHTICACSLYNTCIVSSMSSCVKAQKFQGQCIDMNDILLNMEEVNSNKKISIKQVLN